MSERVVQAVGITTRPNEGWMPQAGRNLLDVESGALFAEGYPTIDGDAKYTHAFLRKAVAR